MTTRDVFSFMFGLFFGVAIMSGTGCAGGPAQIARVATAVVDALPVIDAVGLAAYERELTACADEACADRVRGEWAPFITAMQKIRTVICDAEPAKEGCTK